MRYKLIIYGIGKYGKKAYEFCRRLGISVDCFLETKESATEYNRIPVYSVKHLAEADFSDKIFLIAIHNQNVCADIRLKLLAMGVSFSQIIEFSDLTATNIIEPNHGRYCLFCRKIFPRFYPNGRQHSFFMKHSIIGGGYRANCTCPSCMSGDRERWLYFVLKNHTDVFERDCRVLHFAPEKNICSEIKKQNPSCQYYTADISKGRAQYQQDITSIGMEDNSMDYIIANHVMEHVSDEGRAVKELQRVLKPTGTIVLSFPICRDMPTLEDENVCSDEDRLEKYGEIDHVRLYGIDYKEHFSSYGLAITEVSPTHYFDDITIQRMGFIQDDITLLCKIV